MRKHEAVLITGASGGLGAEFAKQLAEKKYNPIPAARNEGKLYALKNELETKYGVSVHVCAPRIPPCRTRLWTCTTIRWSMSFLRMC